MNQRKVKKARATIMAMALLGCLTMGGISAYFTDAETATNTFTVGEVKLDLEEPNWDPEDVTDITPNETIEKDPQITNIGTNDEYVFVTVSVPYQYVVTAQADGTRNAAADVELFSYEIKEGWVEIGTAQKDAEAGTVTHTYAYGTAMELTPLAKDETTPPVFETVTFANVVEDQGLETTTLNIVVNAYAIQTENINGGQNSPDAVWAVICNQNASTQP